MNKVIALASGLVFFSLPFALYSQSKPATLVKPIYNTDLSFQNSNNVSGVGNIPSNILVSENNEQEAKEEVVSTTTEVVVTTELGETSLRLASGTSSSSDESEIERLSEVVERINQDYEVAEQECRNGSWFERVWCSMTSWL